MKIKFILLVVSLFSILACSHFSSKTNVATMQDPDGSQEKANRNLASIDGWLNCAKELNRDGVAAQFPGYSQYLIKEIKTQDYRGPTILAFLEKTSLVLFADGDVIRIKIPKQLIEESYELRVDMPKIKQSVYLSVLRWGGTGSYINSPKTEIRSAWLTSVEPKNSENRQSLRDVFECRGGDPAICFESLKEGEFSISEASSKALGNSLDSMVGFISIVAKKDQSTRWIQNLNSQQRRSMITARRRALEYCANALRSEPQVYSLILGSISQIDHILKNQFVSN